MTLSPEKARELIHLVQRTRSRELTCDQCLARISEFVEADLAGQPIDEALRIVSEHLEACRSCREEFGVLRDAINTLNDQT